VILTLKGVQFNIKVQAEKIFQLDQLIMNLRLEKLPLLLEGNGSGKSTFAKLVTGLYPADRGETLINGVSKTPEQIQEYYSAIFSDFYLLTVSMV
jgi:putative ATP-binding cassette transporter